MGAVESAVGSSAGTMGQMPQINVPKSEPISFNDIDETSPAGGTGFIKQENNKSAKDEGAGDYDGEESESKEEIEKEGKLLDKKADPNKPKDKAKVEKTTDATKIFKLKSGDQDVQLRSDTMVDVKVDGKVEKVPFSELINGYSGQSSLTKKYTELKKDRSSFENEKKAVQDLLTHSHDRLTKGDLHGFITVVAEAMGADPIQVWKDSQKQILEKLKGHVSISEEELKAQEALDENAFYKARDAREKERQTKEAALKKQQEEASRFHEKTGLDPDQFEELVKEMLTIPDLKPEEITYDLVADYHKVKVLNSKLETILQRVSPDLSEAERNQAIMDVRAKVGLDPMSDEDLEHILTEVYGSQEEKKLARKLKKSDQAAKKKPMRDARSEAMFFDDLD